MTEIVVAILAIALALVLVSVLLPVAERLRIPHTVLLAVLGIALGVTGAWLVGETERFGLLGDFFEGLTAVGVSPAAFLYIFLPPLLFTAGLTIDVRRLFDEMSAVLLLAIVAVFVCIGVVGGVVHAVTGIDIFVCLLLGAIVSTTDPAAVIGILREVGAPKRLSILAEGEALFNDAAAIATFTILIDVLVHHIVPDAAAPGLDFLREFVGGIMLGIVLAHVALFIVTRLGGSITGLASVTVGLAYVAYILGDQYLHVSGVVAVVVAALTLATLGPTRLQPHQWEALRHTWHQLEFWANSLIFLLAAIVAVRVLAGIRWWHLVAVAALYIAAFGARALVLFGLLPVLEFFGRVQPVDRRYKTMIVWGGLRGAVTVALALVAYGNDRLPQDVRDFVAIIATLFVLATLFINAPTLRPLMRFFRLNELDETDKALRDRVLLLSWASVAAQVRDVAKVYGADADIAQRLPHLEAGDAAMSAGGDIALPMDKRIAYGLRTLCARERELYLWRFGQQSISRHIATMLVVDADRLIDQVQTDGVAGYALALQQDVMLDRGFRIALWLHQTFGLERPLADRLADRFETLLVERSVMHELIDFNRADMADLLGEPVADKLHALLDERLQGIDGALKALSLQYGDYADTIRAQHLQRIAIRLESAEYDRQRRNFAISQEVYRDLQHALQERRAEAARRPPLRLGLKLTAMVERVPLFAGLAAGEVSAVGRLLRARVVLPGQKIVTRGERGDAMYFIAAGVAQVKLAMGDVELGEGAFFGEVALLEHKPRNADVVAKGVCHLLRLDARDFRRLLAARPDMRQEIESVAAQRRG
ncbi:cyclic nucleotide-binding domain-containing protein [Vineibacter terrae]|uniref:Cyclic nucleotide-binding domain-containing protein n=1 Tax=Vineibacter terrae TaxID=2586908 RepID=A0A5C8PMA1_9HYPH|nr:cation:proton antiporter [Vineibacter terrae]TXL74436.1 cyclic nucleotide-binding domain-containing protein [Vineibacter terrae]